VPDSKLNTCAACLEITPEPDGFESRVGIAFIAASALRLSFERLKTGWFHEIRVDVQIQTEPKVDVRFATAIESGDNPPLGWRGITDAMN